MNKEQFEQKYNVRLVDKGNSVLMKVVGWLLFFITPDFMARFFTTYRLPFQKRGTIAYPVGYNPMDYPGVLKHELVHVGQQRTAWGLFKSFWYVWLIPLPFVFSGRWFLERDAYLLDIKSGRMTVEYAVSVLWKSYGLVWPPFLMRRWFNDNL